MRDNGSEEWCCGGWENRDKRDTESSAKTEEADTMGNQRSSWERLRTNANEKRGKNSESSWSESAGEEEAGERQLRSCRY